MIRRGLEDFVPEFGHWGIDLLKPLLEGFVFEI